VTRSSTKARKRPSWQRPVEDARDLDDRDMGRGMRTTSPADVTTTTILVTK